MIDELKKLSINDLLNRLSSSIRIFLNKASGAMDANNRITVGEISELRDYITAKLKSGEEKAENGKLLSVLDLVAADKALIANINDDAKEWLEFLGAIEAQIKGRSPLTEQDMDELQKIGKLTQDIHRLLRQ